MPWAVGVGVIVAILEVVVSRVMATDPPPLVAVPLLLIGIVTLPGTLVYALFGGVHDSGLPEWAALALVSVISGVVWATVIRGVQHIRSQRS